MRATPRLWALALVGALALAGPAPAQQQNLADVKHELTVLNGQIEQLRAELVRRLALEHARSEGVESELFHALLEATDDGVAEILRAGERAGLDPDALRAAIVQSETPARLERHRRLVQQAGLRGLPTLDIGRRRLMGEQTEAELEEAIRAAETP